MFKPLPIGTKLVSLRPLYNPARQIEHPEGSLFEIVSLGVDNRYGFYQTRSLNSADHRLAGHYMMYNIADFRVVS